MKHRLTTSALALFTACLAAPAIADVTAADVWENQKALYSSIGVSLNGDLADGRLTGGELNIILPQGVASMQLTTDAVVEFTENSDGTVTITYPSPMDVTVSGGAQGEGSFTSTFTLTHDTYTILASGDPDDVSYASNGQNLVFEMGELSIDGTEDAAFDGTVTISEWNGTSQVTVGNLVNYTSNSTVGETTSNFDFTVDNVTSTTAQVTAPIETTITAALPVGGSDMMNLSAASRDGLSLELESRGEGSDSTTQTALNGEMLNSQETSTGAQTFAMTFDDEGLKLSGDAESFDMTMNDQMIFPGDLEFGIGAITMNYDVPLNASDDPQDFRLATSMQDVTLGDPIWNLFDPAGQLPRDPAEITFDITGVGTNGVDLLNFEALSQMFGPPPIQVDQVTIENLRISAAGADATAQGAMTFDWTDFETIPGLPRPEGQVTVNLNGVNQLMDTLAAMGLIPEEELMMPRMMLGMFATPVGDDMLETVLEVNEQGHVLANGQRLQ